MAQRDKPDVQQFTLLDYDQQNNVVFCLGPQTARIITSKWPRDEAGNIVNGLGNVQIINVSRQALIGLAYEILQAV